MRSSQARNEPFDRGGDVRGVDGAEADDDPGESLAELVGPAQRGEDQVLRGGALHQDVVVWRPWGQQRDVQAGLGGKYPSVGCASRCSSRMTVWWRAG